jgi:hypothetical protein
MFQGRTFGSDWRGQVVPERVTQRSWFNCAAFIFKVNIREQIV